MLLDKVEQELAPYLQQDRRFILALSGGVDSRVLLDLLSILHKKYRFDLKVVHVNHGLSPYAESWANQCRQWCAKSELSLEIENVYLDVDSGESLEQLARNARYQVLQKHLQPNSVLLTAQHCDDQVETFLLALKRGSGPKGLASMAASMPYQNGLLIRPLLTSRREDILAYAQDNQLDWVEDESNNDTRFDRNFIRHEVTPILKSRWPNFDKAVLRSAANCAAQEALVEELLQDKLTECCNRDKSLDISSLLKLSELARSQVIRMWFALRGQLMPSHAHLTALWHEVALARSDANPKLTINGIDVRRFKGSLYLIEQQQDISGWKSTLSVGEPLSLPDNLGSLSIKEKVEPKAEYCFDARVVASPLVVGFNPEGLTACPKGKLGSKSLKKWYQEFGIPSWERRRLPILQLNGQVIAVAGLFIDRDFCGEDCEVVWDKPSIS